MSRIVQLRWPLLAGAAVLIALTALGWLAVEVAFLLFGGLIAILALTPETSSAASTGQGPQPQSEPDIAARSLAEALPNPSLVVDASGVIRHANARATEAFSLRSGDALAIRLRTPDLRSAFDRVAAGGAPERVALIERVPTERRFSVWLAGFDLADETPAFVLMVFDDRTEQYKTDQIRMDFVANASHELRTPLASVTGFIETLQGPAREDSDARDRFLAIMKDQADRMRRLIDDLLSLSRVEMKAHVLPVGEVDLARIVLHVVETLEPLARDLGVVIKTEVPDGPIDMVGDHDELVQVFANLIENACKYGRSGGRVEVRLEADDGGAAVAIRDDGPGIAPEHLPRLTERFYRVDEEVSREHRGTGLGLAIVKHVLARHRGRLAVESVPGEGATFTVSFPFPAAPAPEVKTKENQGV